jgi:two-component system, cell cycle response regulator
MADPPPETTRSGAPPIETDDLTETEKAPVSFPFQDLARNHCACLVVLTGADAGRLFKVDRGELVIGRSPDAEVRLTDSGISRRHARLIVGEGGVMIEDLGSSNGTLVNGNVLRMARLRDGDKLMLGPVTVLKFAYYDAFDEHFQRNLLEAAQRDALTGLYNARYFWQWLASEFSYAKRHASALALVLFDVDHFKAVNDAHGHLAGDRVLFELARTVSDTLRTEDVLARYGGEEFAVVCRGETLEGAIALGERLRSLAGKMQVTFESQAIPITISVGVVALSPEIASPEDLVARADAALYAAKEAGRNLVRAST